jgi:hypothetical protein
MAGEVFQQEARSLENRLLLERRAYLLMAVHIKN